MLLFNRRPTYSDWLRESINKISQNEYHVFANTDIEFKDDFEELISNELVHHKSFLLISRYDLVGKKKQELVKNAYYSQDVWCLNSKDFENINDSFLSSLNIPVGIPRCDNKIAYEFWLRDWKLINPCMRIKKIHHQKSMIRNYKEKDNTIIGNVAFVFPSNGVGKESKFSLMLFTLTNRTPISIQITNWLIE